MKASVECAPKDNQEQLWPSRGLKKVESAPKDNKEAFLFERWVLCLIRIKDLLGSGFLPAGQTGLSARFPLGRQGHVGLREMAPCSVCPTAGILKQRICPRARC
jgi:hypothetical protein